MSDPMATLRQAAALHQSGRLAEAEPLYAATLDALPGHPDALHLYGVLCAQTGRNQRAVELIRAALARRSEAAAYHANFARALRALGRLDEAAGSLRRAVALAPAADAHFSLGNLLKQSGDPWGAATAFRRALALRPDHADARGNLAAALDRLGRADDALGMARSAVVCAPADAAHLYNLARTEQAHGAPALAIRFYRRTLRMAPAMDDARGNLGTVLAETGRTEAAVGLLRRDVALAPEAPDRLWRLADALRHGGDVDAALAILRRLMTLTPGDPTPWQRTVEWCEAADRMDGVTATLTEMARLGRLGRFHWKTAYYHLVRLCNALLAAGRPERVAALLPPVAAAFRDQDAELHAWARFLQGSLAARNGDPDTARRFLAEARPFLPFLAHVSVGDAFARRVEALPPSAVAASEARFTLESVADPGTGPVVVASCDIGYLRRFGPLFLASIQRFSRPGQAVHLHIADPGDDAPTLVAGLAAAFPALRVGWSREPSPAGLGAEERRTFYTFARFLRLPRLMTLYGAPLLVADIDACVLGDPAAFLEALSDRQPLAMQHFPGNLARLYDGVGGGLVILLPEPAVWALFDRIRRFLLSWMETGELHYFLDQIALTAGTDDAVRRGEGPAILPIPTEGRVFRCGGGRFVQILGEKERPTFADAVERLLSHLSSTPPSPDAGVERERFLNALGIDG